MNVQQIESPLRLSSDNPWPGLQSFDEASKSYFYGMRAQTEALFRLVRRETLTLFYGRSGLGKTSLLQAGLFPRLREANLLPIPIRLNYGPKALPFVIQIKHELAVALSAAGIDTRPPKEGESLWEYFHSSDVDFWDSQNRLTTLVLVFDQFEERFTLGRQLANMDAQAEIAFTELSQLVENRPPAELKAKFQVQVDAAGRYDFDKHSCKVIFSLREDFLPELENLRDRFPSILENSLRLQAMNQAQAMEVVLGPGSQLVSDQVAAEIVRFVGGVDERSQDWFTVEPVLLGVVLYGLNQRRHQAQQLTITSDLLSGSREQILDAFYEDALRDLPARARLFVEDGLLTSSGRRDSLAWEDALAEFGVNEQDVLTLINRHLLRREERSDGTRVELVHDRLAEIVRKRRDSRREREGKARELADLQARQVELEREKAIHRRKYRRLLLVCGALAMFGALLSVYLICDRYLYHWRYEAYFSHVIERKGIFEGFGPLTKEQVAKRSSSFKFIRRGALGQLIRVQAIDSKGKLTYRHSAGTYIKFKQAENDAKYYGLDENPSRECQWEFVEYAAGGIGYELAYDKDKRLVWGFAFSPSTRDALHRVAHFLGPDGLPNSRMASAAEYVRFEYWPNGLAKQLSYFDRTGHPRIGRDGAYAIHIDYDLSGLEKRIVTLDEHGRPMLGDNRVAMTEYIRDSMGNPTEIRYLDAAGKPALNKEGWFRDVMLYDVLGNKTEEDFFDTSGKLCLSKDGDAKETVSFDQQGNQTEVASFDTGGKPCLNRFGFAKAALKYDDRGNPIEVTFFDGIGKPRLNKLGIAKSTNKYDARGNSIEGKFFDDQGRPCLNTLGYSTGTLKYDDRSNWIIGEFYGVDGKRCRTKDGCFSKVTASYDDRGNQITLAFFDLQGEPTINRVEGAHLVKKFYDEPGNCIASEYYGVDGKRCLTKNGCAKWTADYDERGNEIAWGCFGLHDEPAVTQEDGTHYVRKSYDERGNCIAWEYYGADSKQCLTKDGYAKVTADYDERGNQIGWACFDLNNKPAVDQSIDCHMIKKAYDERGNCIVWEYYGMDGQKCLGKDGYTTVIADYDQRANQLKWACFDLNGRPAVDQSGGYHMVKKSYDERDSCISWEYYDVEGQLSLTKNAYAKQTADYDEQGHTVRVACFGLRNEPVIEQSIGYQTAKMSYDERGNCIAWEYYGSNGRPRLTNGGYSKLTASYDDNVRQLEQVVFDLNGKSTAKKYDQGRNEIEEVYFDEMGRPTNNENGIARWTAKYSESDYPTDMNYYDRNGKPIIVQIFVTKVALGGQAKELGLQEGDVLVSYDGSVLRNDAELTEWVRRAGDKPRELIVLRNGLRLSFKMNPGLMGINTSARAAPTVAN